MSDDETFIRAIVDNRGDETARLVYADWLDDRDDPRGAYLRAEAEWARTGKKEKALRAAAASLDPVWVARVSRPPVGICADKIVMSTNHDPATPADLDAVEKRLKLKLPTELRALLLNWNGARPSVNRPAQPSRFTYIVSELSQFLHVLPGGRAMEEEDDETRDELWDFVSAAEVFLDTDNRDWYGRSAKELNNYIPLADGGEGDFYLLGVRGKVAGKVAFFHDFTHNSGDPDHLGIVATSLGKVLASIIAEAPEWYRLTRNGERDALLAWLDAGGDINSRDSEHHESLLTVAMSAEDLPLVRELLSRGAKVNRDARELAEMMYGATGKKIHDLIKAAKPAAKAKKKGKK